MTRAYKRRVHTDTHTKESCSKTSRGWSDTAANKENQELTGAPRSWKSQKDPSPESLEGTDPLSSDF